jgi:WD repeat-containing protein 7
MDSSRMVVPFVLPSSPSRFIIEESLANASVSNLLSWGFPSSSTDESNTTPLSCGVVLGCADGSLYILSGQHELHPTTTNPSSSSPHPPSTVTSTPRSASPSPSSRSVLSLGSTSVSGRRSHSPGHSFGKAAPFNLTSRSRIVSGVTTSKVEAPKNYVDYDDEPDKLKDILANSGIRERSVLDGLIPSFKPDFDISRSNSPSKQAALSPSASAGEKSRLNRLPTSLLSATHSPSFSVKSSSPPSSPDGTVLHFIETPMPDASLAIRFYVIPERTGPGCGVVGMHIHGSSVLVLQGNG